jgi:hypothetical protein
MATADDRDDRDDRPARRRRDDDRPHYDEPHRGTLILVLGIIGLVACPVIGVAAWIMGKGDLKKIDAGEMDREGRQLTQVGMILGIVATVLLVLQFMLLLVYAVVFGIVIANAPAPKPAPVNNQPMFQPK